MFIRENVCLLLRELPQGVQLVVAAKGREASAVLEAVAAGAEIIGESYVQEAERVYRRLGKRVKWHFIGHLQRNKVKKAVRIFDMIETVDAVALAAEIDKRCGEINKVMPVLLEINSGREKQKTGVFPEDAEELVREIAAFPHLKVTGLMTMGPLVGNTEDFRPCFRETKQVFDRLAQLCLPQIEMRYLSMGMSNSYRVALEEGANMVRIGTRIFGEMSPKGTD